MAPKVLAPKATATPEPTEATPESIDLNAKPREGLDRWRADPASFCREALGIEPWVRQIEILEAVANNRKVAVRSGHKVSKTTSLGVLALWFVTCFPQSRVIITGPGGRTVTEVVWREIKRLYNGSKLPLGGKLNKTAEGGLRYDDGSEVFGYATDQVERAAGFSAPNMLFIVDEASGVDTPIFDAIQGNMAGGARLVMCSNATQTSGVFYEAFTTKREFWKKIHISSRETAKTGIPGLATREWCDEMLREFGEESPFYQVRVLGNFPSQASNAVIGIALVEAARKRYAETVGEGLLHIGVDPARFGDDESAICLRRGKKLSPPITHRNLDGIQLAGKVLELVRSVRRPEEKPRVSVDVIGIGASVYDHLTQFEDEIEVHPINSSENARDGERHTNLRTELWFATAEWLKDGGALPDDPKLESELIAPLYKFDLKGRYKLESKDDIKKRLPSGRSPDRADAATLSIYEPDARAVDRQELDISAGFEEQGIGI